MLTASTHDKQKHTKSAVCRNTTKCDVVNEYGCGCVPEKKGWERERSAIEWPIRIFLYTCDYETQTGGGVSEPNEHNIK